MGSEWPETNPKFFISDWLAGQRKDHSRFEGVSKSKNDFIQRLIFAFI